jgi:hypothetical protein
MERRKFCLPLYLYFLLDLPSLSPILPYFPFQVRSKGECILQEKGDTEADLSSHPYALSFPSIF